MSRKDYELLASALLVAKPLGMAIASERKTQWRVCCQAIADALASDNVRFNRSRFLAACGVTDDE